jgi:ferredoxin
LIRAIDPRDRSGFGALDGDAMATQHEDTAPETPRGDVLDGAGSAPDSLVVRLGGRVHTLAYQAGDTILATLRRGGLKGPFNCQQGNCGTCIARLDAGSATMRANNVLDDDEVEEGWVLTCQAVPTSREVVVDYDG